MIDVMAATRMSRDNGVMSTHIGMLLFPRLTQLDLTGPYELFNASVGYTWNEDKYSIRAGCSNCLREEYSTAGQFIGTFATVYPGDPRIFRLTGTIKF